MTRIEAFIEKAKNEDVPVSTLLREAKLIAEELDQKEFVEWVNLEMSGYKDKDNYPAYREISGQMKAWNPFYGWVPVMHRSKDTETKLCIRRTKQSIRQLEELLSSKRESFEMPYPDSVADKIIEGNFKTKVILSIDRASLVGVLEGVRNRLLEWGSELKSKGILGNEAEFTEIEKKNAEEVELKFNISNIQNFNGNLGNGSNYSESGKIQPTESLTNKIFWYVIVALIVIVFGNVLSAIIIKFIGI